MVDINRIYQKVQALANKEQRGYITPQEFNLFADHAQQDIFEQYFYDLEQRQRGTGNELEHSDIISNIEEKISLFEQYNEEVISSGTDDTFEISVEVPDIYRLGSVKPNYGSALNVNIADKMALNEINKYQNSPLTTAKESNPVYAEFSSSNGSMVVTVLPNPVTSIFIDYVRKPSTPNWTYIISSTGNALYNQTTDTQHFELHSSEESNLVIKILQLAGVAIKDFNLAQLAAQEEIKNIQQEKQ
tara:strand:+ start:146 stop:880 length:735 start_codon:yes stop_codon:yes gene_type:complete